MAVPRAGCLEFNHRLLDVPQPKCISVSMKYSKGKRLVELGLTGFAYQSTATPTSPKTGVCVW